MNDITIDTRDYDFLIKSKLDSDIKEYVIKGSVIQYSTVKLKVDRDIIGRILDFLGNDLTSIGFDENDEPNEYGIMLENLIDKFSREYYAE